jgi:hypothetical protein
VTKTQAGSSTAAADDPSQAQPATSRSTRRATSRCHLPFCLAHERPRLGRWRRRRRSVSQAGCRGRRRRPGRTSRAGHGAGWRRSVTMEPCRRPSAWISQPIPAPSRPCAAPNSSAHSRTEAVVDLATAFGDGNGGRCVVHHGEQRAGRGAAGVAARAGGGDQDRCAGGDSGWPAAPRPGIRSVHRCSPWFRVG